MPADQTSSGEMAHPLRGGVAKPRVSCSRTTAGFPNQLQVFALLVDVGQVAVIAS